MRVLTEKQKKHTRSSYAGLVEGLALLKFLLRNLDFRVGDLAAASGLLPPLKVIVQAAALELFAVPLQTPRISALGSSVAVT